MDTFQLQSKTTPSLETPREFRHALETVLKQYVIDLKIRQRILLCLSEALTNLIVHARPTVQQISIRFTCNDDNWCLDIFDNSEPWSPNEECDDSLLLTFKEIDHGRGIALLHGQCDRLTYTPSTKQLPNQLSLQWAFPKQQKRQTILVVEDNKSLCFLYQTYLSKHYNVLTASNGYQGLEQLKNESIDLVLSDIRMPEMNGLTLRKKINQQTQRKLIPFIFLTGENDGLIQEQATELGIDDYLIKPINKPQLLSVIQRVLSRSQQVYQKLTDRIDKKITASLKPRAPETVNGWHFQVASRNTGSGGGDLLLHKHFSDSTQLLLTDIMGHDDSAKFFSHAYGGYMHGLLQSLQFGQSPAQLLTQISNSALNDQLLSQITLTCCSVLLSENGQIRLASAGHPAPLLISEKSIQSVPTSGMLLGLLPDAQYQETKIQLKKGQRLAFYTDGLFESADNNKARQQLEEKIKATLHQTINESMTIALQKVMMVFDLVTKAQPNDDALLLLIEPNTPEIDDNLHQQDINN
jgi:CheY-like chemotaxis protein/anti-sigma regulatory factor (Ser/Thr protein kinase)